MPRLRVDPAMLFFILFAILLGGYVRIAQVAQLYFPINDGGMFYRMTIDLVANGFRLPAVTTYNAANIPYAYPPLAFYLAGFLASVFHWPLLDIFRLLPALIATLTIPAFALLADDLLKSRAQVALAILIFALMPATFGWLIMGGGISRSLGFLFSILTLWAAYRLFTHPGRVYIAATALFGAFAILGHPESTIHTAAGALLFFFLFGRNKRGLVNAIIVAVAVILLTAPWWATVVSVHGLAPILAAGRTGGYSIGNLAKFLPLNTTDEMALAFMGCFAVIGIFITLARGQKFLPLWLLVNILVEPRSAALYITPALALLAAITLDEFILAGVRAIEFNHQAKSPPSTTNWAETMLAGRMAKIVFAFLLIYFILSAYLVPVAESRGMILTPDDLAAFGWIKNNLPSGNLFAVMTGNQPMTDPISEWFPTLTGQVSVATVQGYEWDASRDFGTLLQNSVDLQKCAFQPADCLDAWQEATRQPFNYIFIDKASIESNVGGVSFNIPLQQSLLASGDYTVIYETGSVAILKARN